MTIGLELSPLIAIEELQLRVLLVIHVEDDPVACVIFELDLLFRFGFLEITAEAVSDVRRYLESTSVGTGSCKDQE
jgi:hypothetical protein